MKTMLNPNLTLKQTFNTVNPQLSEPRLSEPRLSESQNHLAHDTWITQLLHQRTCTVYTVCAFSVTRVFSLLEDGGVATK